MPRHQLHILILLLALLAGCAAGGESGLPPSPSPTAPQSATATPLPSWTPQSPTPSPAAHGAALGAPIPLRVGETAGIGPVSLTLTAIENDSRCPTQVSCAWEGAAEALIEVTVAGQGAEAATLTLYGQNRETDESRVQVAGYSVRLTALDPYPDEPQPISQGDYVATFVVEEVRSAYTVVGDGSFEGVIVPEQDAGGLDPQAQGYWTPGERDVLALEAGLVRFLQASAPAASPELWQKQPAYKRQYVGLIRDGRRLVHASFFCSTAGDEWRSQVLFVLDGGDCFFQLTYDVERGTYGDLMVNGEG
jgi:hypothetical protein